MGFSSHRWYAYNLYMVGVGLGAILGRVAEVTDSMVEASSLGLAQSLTEEEIALGLIYPRIDRSKCYVKVPCSVTHACHSSP